jgi:hypothetical protein
MKDVFTRLASRICLTHPGQLPFPEQLASAESCPINEAMIQIFSMSPCLPKERDNRMQVPTCRRRTPRLTATPGVLQPLHLYSIHSLRLMNVL